MSAVTKAKKIYTTRKNSLSRYFDSIPQMTQDRSVSLDRLMDFKKGCKAAWEQFALAHENLMQVRPEDEDPEAEEFGALEVKRNELLGMLAEAIAVLNTERLNREQQAKDEQAQQDRDEERDRQQQQKHQQLLVRRLHLANLRNQAKEHLDRLRVDLRLFELPSDGELQVCEQLLANARATMGSAQEQSLTLAEMDPDLATEVLDEDVRETASFANLE